MNTGFSSDTAAAVEEMRLEEMRERTRELEQQLDRLIKKNERLLNFVNDAELIVAQIKAMLT